MQSSDHVPSNTSVAMDVWRQLSRQLQCEDDPALSIERFILQRDAYVRLAEDIEDDVAFLTYEHVQASHDTDLLFGVQLYSWGMQLTMDRVTYSIGYAELSHSIGDRRRANSKHPLEAVPAIAAANILLTIKLLLNGQLIMALHIKGRRVVASEIYLSGYGPTPLALLFNSEFKTFDVTANSVIVLQNHLYKNHAVIPDNYPLLPPIISGKRMNNGRAIHSMDELMPLTKREATDLAASIALEEGLGKKPSEPIYTHLYKTSIFWLVTLFYMAIVLTLTILPVTAPYAHSIGAYVLFIVIGRIGIVALSSYLLAKRTLRIERGERSLSHMIEMSLKKLFTRRSKERS